MSARWQVAMQKWRAAGAPKVNSERRNNTPATGVWKRSSGPRRRIFHEAESQFYCLGERSPHGGGRTATILDRLHSLASRFKQPSCKHTHVLYIQSRHTHTHTHTHTLSLLRLDLWRFLHIVSISPNAKHNTTTGDQKSGWRDQITKNEDVYLRLSSDICGRLCHTCQVDEQIQLWEESFSLLCAQETSCISCCVYILECSSQSADSCRE